ncbi:MAG: Ig-like domain-containing protein [Lachnospiraceae bacterium]|nr:Ig-like domain-containing protein [Lachnospiraceae bacterium]
MRKRTLIKKVISVFLIASLIAGTVSTGNLPVISAASSTKSKICLKIDKRNITKKHFSIKEGKRKKIKATVSKQKKTKITFRSEEKSIVSVSKTGTFTAKKEGIAKITAIAKVKGKTYKSWVSIRVLPSKKKNSVAAGMPARVIKNGTKIKMHFGDTVIPAVLNDSVTAKALIKKLPYTIHVERYPEDFCGTMSDELPYKKKALHYGWLDGDIDYAVGTSYFTILHSGEEDSAEYGPRVNIGVITCKLKKIRSLKGDYDVLIELAKK